MSVQLHLPDLPEVPISLGADETAPQPRRRPAWHVRLRDALSTYLPLLLMALLALGTWWLVKHTPSFAPAPAPKEVRRAPDSVMSGFAIERFDRTGRLRVRVDGAVMRHFPDTDRYEIEEARIRATAPDGRETVAVARKALANGDLSEVQLQGGAQVTQAGAQGQPLSIRSEFLHAFLVTERVVTHLPVQVMDGANELRAAALSYDHGRRLLDLQGPTRARLVPGSGG